MQVDRLVGQLIRDVRQDRGLSLQGLADRLAELGAVHYDKAKLSRIEKGQAVTISEWLELAAGLSCPPLLLVLPLGSGEHVEVLPGQSVHADLVAQWIEGSSPLTNEDRYAVGLREWHEASRRLWAWQHLRPAQNDFGTAVSALRRAEEAGDAPMVARRLEAMEEAGQQLYSKLEHIWQLGMTPPAHPAEHHDAMARIGLDLSDVGVGLLGEGTGNE